MTLTEVHARLSNAVILYAVILGVWGFYGFVQRRQVSEGYWGALTTHVGVGHDSWTVFELERLRVPGELTLGEFIWVLESNLNPPADQGEVESGE